MTTPFSDFGWHTVLVFAVPTGALTQDELGQALPQTWAQATWSGQPAYFYLTDPLNPPYGRKGLDALLEARAGN